MDEIRSEMMMPILIGENYENLMSDVVFLQDGWHVEMTLKVSATGPEAMGLLAYLTSGSPQALQFVPVPVAPYVTSKENI